MENQTRTKVIKFFLYFFLIFLAVICFLPFYLMIINSTRSGTEIMSGFSLLAGGSIAENWKIVVDNME